MKKRHLSIVPDKPAKPDVTSVVLRSVDMVDVATRTRNILRKLYPSAPASPRFAQPFELHDLSPTIGMGMDYNDRDHVAQVHVDPELLKVGLDAHPKRMYGQVALHFVLSAGAFEVIKGSPEIMRNRKQTGQNHSTAIAAVRWASFLAFDNLGFNDATQRAIVRPYREHAETLSRGRTEDFMYYRAEAQELGVPPPKIALTSPWALGVGYPQDLRAEPGA
jgi:hypothetical protein